MLKIVLKNFKCFEEQEINFRNLTILAGANGSGKSTVIQAILLFLQTYKKSNIYELLLNGYYLEAGTAGNILYENAKEDYIAFEFLFDETPKNGHSPKNLANIKLFIKTMLIKIVIKLELALVIFLTLLIIIK